MVQTGSPDHHHNATYTNASQQVATHSHTHTREVEVVVEKVYPRPLPRRLQAHNFHKDEMMNNRFRFVIIRRKIRRQLYDFFYWIGFDILYWCSELPVVVVVWPLATIV